MKLIVGLGNPGFRYRNTRHNAGFLAVKELSKKSGIRIAKKKCRGLSGVGSIDGKKVNLFMPQTYMNISGEAVREIVKESRVRPRDILVIYDDIDLNFGFIRFREKGSSAGHNGLKSAIESLGTSEFPRLRIGIGKSQKITDVVSFVLKPFSSDEKLFLKVIISDAAECAMLWVKEGPNKAMDAYNKRQNPDGSGK